MNYQKDQIIIKILIDLIIFALQQNPLQNCHDLDQEFQAEFIVKLLDFSSPQFLWILGFILEAIPSMILLYFHKAFIKHFKHNPSILLLNISNGIFK